MTLPIPMTEDELATIRARVLSETSEHLRVIFGPPNGLHDAKRLLEYADQLRKLVGMMTPIVAAVAEADNSDSSVCYQVCNVRWYNGETWNEEMEMRHDSECIVTQAEAVYKLLLEAKP